MLRQSDPHRIGPYEVVGRLGAGGMGKVYLAESRSGLRLAVKVVRAEHAQDRMFRARFRQEVRAAQTVGGVGTYTARVVDADTEAERPWMATEFVEGPNLRDAVLDHGPLPEDAVLTLAAALGEALGAIHGKGMVHRDLKPSNILLAPDGPRVIDFGIVRALEATSLTRTGTIVGSVGYVSPEQIRNGAEVGPASDVFSLGAVLAYASSGREPFGEGQDSVILLRILTRDFDLTGVPKRVLPLVESCLGAEPEERPTPRAVVEAAGHTGRSLRDNTRPGWLAFAPDRSEGDERWLPDRDSGEDRSRVEYVAPATVVSEPSAADVPTTPPGGTERGPSRRSLLGIASGGLLASGAGVGGLLFTRDSGGGSPGGSASKSPSPKGSSAARPTVAWRYESGEPDAAGGPCVGVSSDGGVLYVAVDSGTVRAVSGEGEELWRVRLQGGGASTPVVTSDAVFCTTWGGDEETPRSLLCAVDLEGQLLWSRNLEGYASVPVLAGDGVVVGTGTSDAGEIRAYSDDGSEQWRRTTPAGVTTDPLVADGVVYAGTYGDRLVALDAADGTVLWSVPAGADVNSPALVGGKTLVTTSGTESRLHGFDLDGNRIWSSAELSEVSGCVAAGSLGIVEIGGTLTAIEADGSKAWTYESGAEWLPGTAVAGETIYVQTDSAVHAVGLDGKRRWSVPVDTSGSMVAPAAHGTRLYVNTPRGITALDLKV
ncbi:PQQ-binding-like beta-propeller repeat protein [Streptomyces sp. NL15-2K]|uniref:protein kinase domain-containing protein n=1 Tax=Streptomyces sp. NL15-2K TaxID=376149 RepID=UPI00209C5462|nr:MULTISPECIES: PQQ-binding-like beta-propeller repeat protein [Actinomycetes]WKX10973.1 PQQ-binding-like beta-propeller repeat protein [Kutzneria buriramensis]